MKPNLIIAGIGTDVGKTIVSAILTSLYKGTYWKPIQTGMGSDMQTVSKLVPANCLIFPPTYSFKAPLSPHHAALLENCEIDLNNIQLPNSGRPLIIESIGGVLVPLTTTTTTLDLFKRWDAQWIIVSKHYLGSINHTLLTLEILQRHGISVLGIIFNGDPHLESEKAILGISKQRFLGRLLPEKIINKHTIDKYVKEWSHLK